MNRVTEARFDEHRRECPDCEGLFCGNRPAIGWEIPAVLEQDLNSDLPGDLKALVTANVYDTATGRYLLIPQGAIPLNLNEGGDFIRGFRKDSRYCFNQSPLFFG